MDAGASSLTAAELRLLPLLATHMSYPGIAAELSVSANTIKSQAYSLFRKLGASSRSQAVARSRELALLEGQDTETGANLASDRGRLWLAPSVTTAPATHG
jgi:ATP/maltotriose-dependent transcriptional regulator MalT